MGIFKNRSENIKVFFSYLFLIPSTVFLPNRQALFSIVFLISAIKFYNLKKSFGKVFLQYFILIIVLFIYQTIYFERFSYSSTIRLFMNILLPYFLLKIVGQDYIKYYIQIIFYIAIISFIFYFPSLISNSFHSLIGKIAPLLGTDAYLKDQNFIIYTWEAKNGIFLRNSGNFTEPGSFACWLNLALVYNILHEKQPFSKKNIVFIIAIFTTLSTSGYIALFFIYTAYFLLLSKKKSKYLLIPFMIYLSFQAYTKLYFLQEKISVQIESQVENASLGGRFGSALLDLKDLKKYPLSGRGLTKATRFDDVDYWVGDEAPRAVINSITDTMLKHGIIGFSIYLYFLITSINFYLNFHRIDPKGIYIILGSLFIISFSQQILLTPLFLSLIFFKDLIPTYKRNYFSNAKNIYYYSKL